MAARKTVALAGMIAVFLFTTASLGEVLYNGIVLPEAWPPKLKQIPADPVTPSYIKTPPEVIPIDVGRQLFVDDFLLEQSTLTRAFHLPRVYEKPVHQPMSYSGGIWYDPQDKTFKRWYNDKTLQMQASDDGIVWKEPVKTNIPAEIHSCVVLMDLDEPARAKRWKIIYTDTGWVYHTRYSADGITWSDKVRVDRAGDRSSGFYNPFRKVWVFSIRLGSQGKRSRWYWETPDLEKGPFWKPGARTNAFMWTGVDSADLPDSDMKMPPQLYNLDAVPYESVMLGFFTIWNGDFGPDDMKTPPTDKARRWQEQKRPKLNVLKLGYSRDGWSWARPDRSAFINSVDDPKAWNFGNIQSVGGGVIVLGDQLRIYFSGRSVGGTANGVAFLRRDGFVSMDAADQVSALTTRPVSFIGKHLFVNVDDAKGELRVEVLDEQGNVIAPFTKANCVGVSADTTLQRVTWKGAADLSALSGKPVKFRFHLRNGKLYAFWVSPDDSGASHGYVAAGGPGFTGATDTVGMAAYEAAKALPAVPAH